MFWPLDSVDNGLDWLGVSHVVTNASKYINHECVP
jgi:hypothetical protein